MSTYYSNVSQERLQKNNYYGTKNESQRNQKMYTSAEYKSTKICDNFNSKVTINDG